MIKIFISYSSKDRAIVDELAAVLEIMFDEEAVWYDRELNRSGGQQWWNLILEQIRACDVFIYVLSPHVLKSEPCRREYGYALALGKPILPLVIAEIEIRYLPVELQAAQLVNFQRRDRQQQKSLKASLLNLPPAPPLPSNAKELAPATPLDPAGVLFDRITRLTHDSDQQRLVLLAIEDLHEEADYRKFVPELLERLLERDDVLTVRNMKRAQELQTRLVLSSESPVELQSFKISQLDPLLVNFATLPVIQRPTSLDLMPAPFAWIDIPGKIGKNWKGDPYKIAKYPVTNAQFAKFIEAGGYQQQKWWTPAGWQAREQGIMWDSNSKSFKRGYSPWTETRYWQDKRWNGAEQPVVGISWFEAIAFCLWLSDTTGEEIMLPASDQWQYAAQGDDGRTYPWGNTWDSAKCCNSVEGGYGSAVNTSIVRLYEINGDSPFGMVDMAGNVWEWCLTDYDNKTNNINSNSSSRALHGGAWSNHVSELFRCDYLNGFEPQVRSSSSGFRLSKFK